VRFSIGVKKNKYNKMDCGDMEGQYLGEKKKQGCQYERVIDLAWISKQGCRERVACLD
jgi:hypothetical protein